MGRAPTYKRIRRSPHRTAQSWRTLEAGHRLLGRRDSWRLPLWPGLVGGIFVILIHNYTANRGL